MPRLRSAINALEANSTLQRLSPPKERASLCVKFSAGLRLWRAWCTQKNEAPKIQRGGLGERCELSQRGPQPKSNLVYYGLKI